MSQIEDVSTEQLRAALENIEGSKPSKRLIAAIAYKNGVTQTELAEWFDVQRKTIYNWFSRLEEDGLEEAVTDAPRPGRPPKLSDQQRDELHEILSGSPDVFGYEASAWSPRLVQSLVAEQFDVSYSLPSCRRLMLDAGLRYLKPASARTDSFESDERERGGQWRPT